MHLTRVENRKEENMYTGTVKCYSSSVGFHWLDLRLEKLEPGLAFSCSMKYGGGVKVGPGALPLSNYIIRESSWPWPRLSGYNDLHDRKEVRTQEV